MSQRPAVDFGEEEGLSKYLWVIDSHGFQCGRGSE